jgi:hypothetical protein
MDVIRHQTVGQDLDVMRAAPAAGKLAHLERVVDRRICFQ